jgi:tetratricopeptide (TPR) repeat protein
MWLTGFDAPCLHTMYVDKPMQGHGLMQAIARVNRVFKDKPGGLVVDYLGLADELKQALATYTESGGTGRTALNQEEAVAELDRADVYYRSVISESPNDLASAFAWIELGTVAARRGRFDLAAAHLEQARKAPGAGELEPRS